MFFFNLFLGGGAVKKTQEIWIWGGVYIPKTRCSLILATARPWSEVTFEKADVGGGKSGLYSKVTEISIHKFPVISS